MIATSHDRRDGMSAVGFSNVVMLLNDDPEEIEGEADHFVHWIGGRVQLLRDGSEFSGCSRIEC
jgi:hypothetical protein